MSEEEPDPIPKGLVRKELDKHVGHESPTPNPFHQTAYGSGSPNVFVNNKDSIRLGDTTTCGDPATGSSPNVFVNNILVHRKSDSTGGHGSFVANSASTGSPNVFANQG